MAGPIFRARRGPTSPAARNADGHREEFEEVPQREPQVGEPVALVNPEDGVQDDLERQALHPRRERERLALRPQRDLLLGDAPHEFAVALETVAVKRRKQQPALAQVRCAVEQQHAVAAQDRAEDLVALTRQELVRIAGEDLAYRVGVGEHHPRALLRRDPQGEHVAVALVASGS